jgi:hypothetical protein
MPHPVHPAGLIPLTFAIPADIHLLSVSLFLIIIIGLAIKQNSKHSLTGISTKPYHKSSVTLTVNSLLISLIITYQKSIIWKSYIIQYSITPPTVSSYAEPTLRI